MIKKLDMDIFVNCNWVVTRWQQYSTHLHTNNTQNNTTNWEEYGPCPVLASYTLAFALQMRKKHGKKPQSDEQSFGNSDCVLGGDESVGLWCFAEIVVSVFCLFSSLRPLFMIVFMNLGLCCILGIRSRRRQIPP